MTTTMRDRLLGFAPILQGFRAKLGDQDMRPLLYVEHDGELCCTVFAGPNGRDMMVNAIIACGVGMDALALTFAFDAKFASVPIPEGAKLEDGPLNPVTGRPWRQGEMKALAEDGAAERFGITDALALVRIERGNSMVEGMSIPYRVAAGTVDYLPTDWAPDEIAHNMEGGFADALREAMSRPTLGSIISRDPLAHSLIAADELTPEETVVHQRCVVLKMLMHEQFPIMLEPRSDTEVEVYCRSLGVTRADFEEGGTVAYRG